VFAAWQAVRELGEARLARVRELVRTRFDEPGDAEPLDRAALEERRQAGGVLLLDVRPECEFRSGHIPGAVSLPLDELEARRHVLPVDQEILVCGRGPYCGFAHGAVVALRAAGYRARRLSIGYPDWQAGVG
jgi:rhodanese-related sulfurtransferase